ncbi:MAG: TolC family protein [bacterium]
MQYFKILRLCCFAAFLGAIPATGAVTLDECILATLKNNTDIQAATERVQAAEAAIRAAKSAYYPMLGGAVSYARTDNPPQAFMMMLNQRSVSMQADFNNPPETENLALSLGIKYRLYDFGRSGLDVEMARGGAEVSRLLMRGLQNEMIHQVARGYFSVLQADAFVAVQEEAASALEEGLRVAYERLKAGGSIGTDVLNLEVQVAQARDDLIRARHGVKLAIAALNAGIGTNMVDASHMPLAMTPPDSPPRTTEDMGAAGNRPELKAARKVAEIRHAAVRKARREYLPAINAFGSLDWNSDVSSNFEESYMVGIVAEVELFDGFRRGATVSGSAALERAAEAEAGKALSSLQLDLTMAVLQAVEARERLEVVRKGIENAEEALRITQQSYQQGAAALSELLTARTGLSGTRTRNVEALYDYLIAISNLARARGELVNRYAGDE